MNEFKLLIEQFNSRVNSRNGDIVWSPRPCDLTPLEYSLTRKVGFIKTKPNQFVS